MEWLVNGRRQPFSNEGALGLARGCEVRLDSKGRRMRARVSESAALVQLRASIAYCTEPATAPHCRQHTWKDSQCRTSSSSSSGAMP